MKPGIRTVFSRVVFDNPKVSYSFIDSLIHPFNKHLIPSRCFHEVNYWCMWRPNAVNTVLDLLGSSEKLHVLIFGWRWEWTNVLDWATKSGRKQR